MRTIYLDTETRSRVDLKKSNVYRYVEDPDFSVTILSYAVDDDDVEVTTDRAEMTRLVRGWINSDATLIAHNSAFDRIVLQAYTGTVLPIERWDDTMPIAAEHGYPSSLANLAGWLGGEQKDTAGTRLINLFAKVNPRTGRFVEPWEKPEQWAEFLSYAKTDVETLRSIHRRLPDWPTETERQIWFADQRINDRGIRVDTLLAQAAVDAAEENSREQVAEIIRITGVANPSSVQQMSAWFAGTGLELPNLQAATVKLTLERDDLSAEQRSVLELRQELALVASKKYIAALDRVNEDGRLRGSFQFFGAHTGRFCLTGDHEVLTPGGWKRIDEWTGGAIACWSGDETISFQKANQVSFDYEGDLYSYEGKRIKQLSTPDHRMPVRRRTGALESVTVEDIGAKRTRIAIRGFRNAGPRVVDDELRVLVMTQADGHFNDSGTVKFHFTKSRKVDRCRHLLRRVGIVFTERVNGDATTISVPRRLQPIWLSMFRDKRWGPWLWDRNPSVFFEELELWDGYRGGPNSIQYSTTVKQNADMVQAFAHMSGMFCRVLEKDLEVKEWSTAYIVNIWLSPPDGHDLREEPKMVPFSGRVYCAETKTGYFLVRRGGSVWVTGNSGRGVQLQNLPAATITPREGVALDTAIEAEAVDVTLGFGGDANTLKALVRSMFLGPFTVVDYSAIEARVLAWVAGEQWALDAFEGGRDIYVETANRMGGMTRKEGKVATLALGYNGGVGSLKAMGATGSDAYLQRIVDRWREANANIAAFWPKLGEVFWKGGTVGRITVEKSGTTRRVVLPSGRAVTYQGVRRVMAENRWGNVSPQLSFRDPKRGLNSRMDTYGGKLTENLTQAIARDVLTDAILALERGGYTIVGHVHDEVILEGDHPIKEVATIMSTASSWTDGLPLDAEGDTMPRYRK